MNILPLLGIIHNGKALATGISQKTCQKQCYQPGFGQKARWMDVIKPEVRSRQYEVRASAKSYVG